MSYGPNATRFLNSLSIPQHPVVSDVQQQFNQIRTQPGLFGTIPTSSPSGRAAPVPGLQNVTNITSSSVLPPPRVISNNLNENDTRSASIPRPQRQPLDLATLPRGNFGEKTSIRDHSFLPPPYRAPSPPSSSHRVWGCPDDSISAPIPPPPSYCPPTPSSAPASQLPDVALPNRLPAPVAPIHPLAQAQIAAPLQQTEPTALSRTEQCVGLNVYFGAAGVILSVLTPIFSGIVGIGALPALGFTLAVTIINLVAQSILVLLVPEFLVEGGRAIFRIASVVVLSYFLTSSLFALGGSSIGLASGALFALVHVALIVAGFATLMLVSSCYIHFSR